MSTGIQPPLKGVRVVELTHTILGPSCGMILADLGAEVIKVEPVDGDRTRKLKGFGQGFFGYFNRNKKSLALDADAPEGRKVLETLLKSADVMIENFAPGSMSKRGLGPEHLEKINPRLVYCALKGFLPGPYSQRMAADEVAQMMGGLAFMTGLPGRPMRAGASVTDLGAASLAAMGILAALLQRERTLQRLLPRAIELSRLAATHGLGLTIDESVVQRYRREWRSAVPNVLSGS